MAEGARETARPAAPVAAKLTIFLSYSRADGDFADELVAGLEALGFQCSIDRHSIVEGEDWKKRLGGLIADSDTVVFVISPDSARSTTCQWEIDESVRLSKRILPVLWRPTGAISVPEKLAALNYVRFDPLEDGKPRSFMAGLKSLTRALETDLDWLREHTRLLARAMEWDAGGRPANRLLSGDDIAAAKAWISTKPRTAPDPTPLHLDFVSLSETWEDERQNETRRQLAERERLVREAEAAVQRAADAESARRRARRGLAWAAAAAVTLLVAGISGFAYQQASNALQQAELARVAETRRAEADAEKKRADEARNAALLSQSKYLADLSRQVLEVEDDPGTAMLLALEALPDENSDDEITRTRPYWAPAEVSLEAARRLLREKAILKGHTATVTSVVVTPDGARIVTGSDDGTARVWDARTFVELATLKGHTGNVNSVAVSPDGARIVTASGDMTARVWEPGSGAGPSPREWREVATLKSHTGSIMSVVVSPDGARIVTGLGDGTARVWDAKTFVELATLKGHTNTVNSVAVSPDGARIVTASGDMTARVWDAKTFTELATLKGHNGSVKSVAVSLDGARIVTGSYDNTARVWNANTFTEIGQLPHTNWVTGVAVSPDSARIVTGSLDGAARVWDARTFVELATLKNHTRIMTVVAVSPDGARIVTGSGDNTARVWDARVAVGSDIITGHTGGVLGIAVTPDSRSYVSSSDDKTLRVWNAHNNQPSVVLEGHSAPVRNVAVTPDGSRIVSGGEDGTIRVWDTRSGEALKTIPTGDNLFFYAMALSPDGRLVAGRSKGSTIGIWVVNTGQSIRVLRPSTPDMIVGLGFTHDGSAVVVGSGGPVGVLELSTGAERLRLTGHRASNVFGVGVTRDGTRIVTGAHDHTLRIWDAGSGEALSVLAGHTDDINGLAISVDGSRIVSASQDKTIRIWEQRAMPGETRSRWQTIATLKGHQSDVRSVAIANDDGRIVSGANDKTIRVWPRLPAGQALVAEARAAAPRCLSTAQRERYHLSTVVAAWCTTLQKFPYDVATVTFHASQEAAKAGNLHLAEGRPSEAIEAFEKAVSLEPSTRRTISDKLAEAYVNMAQEAMLDVALHGRSPQVLTVALEGIQKALTVAALDKNAQIKLQTTRGELRLALGQTKGALEDLVEVSGYYAGAGFFWSLGKAHEINGDRGDAGRHYRKARIQPAERDSDFDRYGRAQARAGLVQLGADVAAVDAAVELVLSARIDLEAKRSREAIAGFENAIDLDAGFRDIVTPQLAEAHFGIAWSAFLDVALHGKPVEPLKDALVHADKAIALLPDEGAVFMTRGHTRLALGRFDEALADLDKAITLGMDDIGTWYGRGRAHELKGNHDAAIADYRKALADDVVDAEFHKYAHAQARARLAVMGVVVEER